jgi:hypothetical protein
MHVASVEGFVAHPAPDLQSLQDTYLPNVERIEEQAERMSLNSKISDEMQREQRSNPVVQGDSSAHLGPIRPPSGSFIPSHAALGPSFINIGDAWDANVKKHSGASGNDVTSLTAACRFPTPPKRLASNDTFTNLYNQIFDENNRSCEYAPAMRIPSDTGFSDIYDEIAGEIEDHLQVGAPGYLRPTRATRDIVSTPIAESSVDNHHLFRHSPAEPFRHPVRMDYQEGAEQLYEHGTASARPDSTSLNYLESNNDGLQPTNAVYDRLSTAASTDSYRQVQTLFRDFDGIHHVPSIHCPISEVDGDSTESRQPAVLKVLATPDIRVPPPADGMVYYPAPVPMTLNLPQRLSVSPTTNLQAKRRTRMLATLHADARKPFGPMDDTTPTDNVSPGEARKSRARLSTLPPQLRASMFFENSSSTHEVTIRESAAATLEELLDASTSAPVSAFTDHPIVGHIGSAVYRQENVLKITSVPPDIDGQKDKKRRSSFLGLYRTSHSSGNNLDDDKIKKKGSRAFSLGAKLDDSALGKRLGGVIGSGRDSGATTPRSGSVGEDDGSESEAEDVSDPEADDLEYHGLPTTLLAELQLRKAQQKSRNKTALTVNPNGMHSTLLELDAVTQIQRQKRRKARVTLAWEDPDPEQAVKDAAACDEDVPLGMLYAGNGKVKQQMKDRGMADWDRPLGLIEMREREDNEPLSRRRDRLKGIDSNRRRGPSPSKIYTMAPMVKINGEEKCESEEEETLAQRSRRLKNQRELDNALGEVKTRPISEAFSVEMLNEFDSMGAGEEKQRKAGSQNDNDGGSRLQAPDRLSDDEEETLGQRRARLQRAKGEGKAAPISVAEASAAVQAARPTVCASTNMANLLQAFPAGAPKQVLDEGLASRRPQDSLLGRSEVENAARKAHIREGNAQRTTSNTFNKPLLEFSTPPMAPISTRQESGGFKHRVYNTSSEGIASQSISGFPYSGVGASHGAQYAASGQMGFQQPGSNRTPGTGVGIMAYPQRQGINGLGYGVGYNPQQRPSSYMGVPAQPLVPPDPFLDNRGRARIDAWRQGVDME